MACLTLSGVVFGEKSFARIIEIVPVQFHAVEQIPGKAWMLLCVIDSLTLALSSAGRLKTGQTDQVDAVIQVHTLHKVPHRSLSKGKINVFTRMANLRVKKCYRDLIVEIKPVNFSLYIRLYSTRGTQRRWL